MGQNSVVKPQHGCGEPFLLAPILHPQASSFRKDLLTNHNIGSIIFITYDPVAVLCSYGSKFLYNNIDIELCNAKKYETISVPADAKRVLEKAKGKNEWGNFLLNLYTEATGSEHEEAFKKLVGILTDDDLKAMAESSRRFREGFVLRYLIRV